MPMKLPFSGAGRQSDRLQLLPSLAKNFKKAVSLSWSVKMHMAAIRFVSLSFGMNYADCTSLGPTMGDWPVR